MRAIGIGLCFLVSAIFVGRSGLAAADVAPVRKSSRKNREAVTERLAQVGVESSRAQTQASALTSQEASFFAGDPQRVQVVGALAWYEILAGIGFGTILVVFGALLVDHSRL